MEEDNDMEQVTGSPTAGENEFVHVESLDSSSINQVERLEQDDGVVITGVDTGQDEAHDAITPEDGGQDEFVDCPDDLVSNEARSPGSASMARQQPFSDDTEDVQYNVAGKEKEITPLDYEEERRVLMKEVSNLHGQLKALSNQQSLVDENDAGDSTIGIAVGGEKSNLPLREMVNECSKFIEFSVNERLQSEGTIRELYATLHMKDKEIEDLMIRVNEQSKLQDVSAIEVAVDRILSSLVNAFGGAEFSDTSVSGKLYYLEEGTSFLLNKYNYLLSGVDMLAHCLAEVKSDFQMENYMETVFPSLQEELVGIKQKELEFNEKTTVLEYNHGQLMEQLEKNKETIELLNAEIGKLKGEVEQEKTRYSNTKEKLSMAVTKGKALVQQRDSLKQLVAEKTSELERCLVELQEKSTALEAAELRNGELTQTENLANSLQEALTQRDVVLGKCTELLCQGLPEVAQFPNLEYQLSWLLESYNLAKDQSIKLHDENNAMKEAASSQIDHLTASLLAESQEKYHLKEQLEEIACKYEEIVEEKKQMVATPELSPMDSEVFEKIQSLFYVSNLESKIYEQILELELDNRSHEMVKVSEELHASKDELNSLQLNLQRSEEKASLLREKLSLAVKKGKGLVQERENMKQQMAEKNVQIEALMVDFQKQESTLSDYRDQVAKLESERDQIGQFLAQSNMMLQEIIEIIDGISVTFPSELKEPGEKMKWFAAYLSECQIAKAQAEHELGDVKDEAGQLTSKLTEALVNMKSLEDALSASEENISQLSEKKRELEVSKIQAEQEVEILKEEIDTLNNKLVETLKIVKSLEDKLAGSEKTTTLLTEEKSELENAKCHVEEEIDTLKNKLMETLKIVESLEDKLAGSEKTISLLTGEKSELESAKCHVEEEIDTLNNKMVETLKIVESLEDKLAGSEKTISSLTEEKSELENAKCHVEEEIDTLNNKLVETLKIMKSLEDKLAGSEKTISLLTDEKSELESAKCHVEEEIDTLNNKLVETLNIVESLEDKLAGSEKSISLLTEEKSELENAKRHVEEELHKAMDEISSQTSKYQETLSHAENKISMLIDEKEEAQMEVQKVKEEVSIHASNLDDAKKTIKSLEDSIFQLNTNVSQFSHENEKAVDIRTVLESEIKKLKEEAELEISTLKTELSTCRHELAAVNDKWGPQLSGFFGNLQVLLKDESLFSLFKQSFENKIESLKNIDRLLKDMKDSFDIAQLQDHPAIEENFQSPTFLSSDLNYDWNTGMIDDEFNAEDTEGIGSYVGKTFDNLNTKNQFIADQFGNYSTFIDDIIASLLKKLEAIGNTVPLVVQQTVSLQQQVKNVQMDKQMQDNKVVMLESGIKALVSACADVTKELKFHFENDLLQADTTIGLEKSYPDLLAIDDVAVADVKVAVDELLFAARNVQSVKENMSTTIESLQTELKKTGSMYDKSKEVIEELQVKLEKTKSMYDEEKRVIEELQGELEKISSMYDKSKEVIEELQIKLEETRSMYDNEKRVIEELQGELEKTRSMYDKVKDENDAFQKRVFKLETEVEASRESCNEMSSRLEDYQAKEDKWIERERELSAQSISSVKDHEDNGEKALLSASQLKTLFDKIDGITIPFPNLVAGDKQAQDSNSVEKLFYIIDNVNELLDQLTLLTHAKEELQSTLSKQALEVDHLKGEFRDGLQNVIKKLGGNESIGVRKPADVAELLIVLEDLVQSLILEGQGSRSELVETQKIAEELSRKVKSMEDFIQNRTGGPDMIQERGVIASTSFPTGSEISEIDDQVTVGKVGLPLVPSAAQMRSLRKAGSSEQLAITIDSESDRLLDKAKTVEDKGHIFKSLHTSGLVPVQGKMIADRLDGLWVSGGQALMRRPRARLGLIAYWLILHLWVLGTIL